MQQVARKAVMLHLKSTHCPTRCHVPPAPKRVRSTRARALHAPTFCRAYVSTTSAPNPTRCPAYDPLPIFGARAHDLHRLTAPHQLLTAPCQLLTSPRQLLTVDQKFDQLHSDLFSRPDSIFFVCFSIRNFDMPSDEISRPIHVIFNGDNFAQWSQTMRNYLKGHKLWLYVSGDCPIPEKMDK